MRLRILPMMLATLVLCALRVHAQPLPSGVQKGASMVGLTEYTFPNGLHVLLLPDPGSSKLTVNITYLVGSRHEGYGESGMAHLLEHLNFIRSTHDRNIKKELEDHGAQWNGTTSYDRTNYYETVPASDENLKWALGLEAERMVNMRIEKAILDIEMTVVRNEFERGENSVTSVLQERVMSTAFLWHNYGKSVIGSRADIEKVPIDRLAAFYHKYYQPDNAVITIAGQIDTTRTLNVIATTLGAIARPTRKLDATYTLEPIQDGERTVELRRVGKGKNLIIAFHSPSMASPDAAALEVMTGILSGRGGTGRLDKALVDSKKAVAVGTNVQEMHDPGLVMLMATLSDDQSLDEAKKIMLDTVASLIENPPTKDEVDRAKTLITQRMDRTFANSQALAMELNEVIADGDWRLLFTNYEELKRVSSEDVVSVAQRYFKDSNRTVGLFIPEDTPDRTTVPDAPAMDALLKTYPPDIKISSGEATDPSPAAIEKKIQRSTIGGVRVAILPKGTRGNRVDASLVLHFGNETSLADKYAAAQMTDQLLMRGTKTKSRQQIQDEMQNLNATIAVSSRGSLSSITATVSTTAENLVPAMKLALEILREPAFPAADFDQIRKQIIATIDRGRTDPATLTTQLIQSTLNPFPRSDVRHIRTIDEQIEDLNKVTLDDVHKFHQQFYGASAGELVVVGQFDSPSLLKAANDLLGAWKSAAPYQRVVLNYKDVQTINSKIETPDKENAQFNAGLRFMMKDTDPDYAAMLMANYMFGGGGLTSRMPNRIRNREGLSYDARSGFSAGIDGNAATFSASVIANPTNTPKVEASFMDELSKTLREGFNAPELGAAKKAIHDERVGGRSSDAGLLSLIAIREQYARTLTWDQDLDAKLEALTVDQVNAAFRKYIDPAKMSIVKGGDFKAAKVYQ